MTAVQEALKRINTYNAMFFDSPGLPIVGQSDEGIIRVGQACWDACARGEALTPAEANALQGKVPEGVFI